MKKNKKISLQPMLVFPFLELPHQINQVNAAALGSGLMDAGDQAALARHFREQIEIFDAVTSINFSNRDGGLVNAGREGHRGDLYKIVTDDFKSGPFRKYALDSRGRRAELISTLHHFDGRTRPWYVEAVEKSQPVWSEPYVLFTGQDLSINAARPVFDDQNHLLGVVAVDLFLSHLSEFLAHLNTGASGRNIILERSGLMIAASIGEKPFTRSPETADYRRKGLDDSTDLPTRAAAEALQDTFGGYRQIRDPASFEFDLPETGLEVMANVEQMQDLLDNLMQNAWGAMGEKTGRIVVDAGTADSADIPPEPRWPLTFSPDAARYVRVSVKDQGDGIAPGRMEKIFDPFFSTRFIGRGLGLSLSLSIVKYHHGCIAVESVPGKGSTFHVFLPQAV